MRHIHFIGIGGTGLSAIARVLLESGYTVSGSDKTASTLFDALRKAGAHTYLGHTPENIKGADLVIRSSAIQDDNSEVIAARSLGIPVLKRADFMQQLLEGRTTIAIAGTHGKTTTTSMLVWILTQLQQDPSFIVGGVIKQLDRNAKAGNGPFFVIEADEYDRMFLGLNPQLIVITNIEHDHPDCYPTPKDYQLAFKDFLDRLKINGKGFLCIDDKGVNRLLKSVNRKQKNLLTYGFDKQADYQPHNIKIDKNGYPQFDVIYKTSDAVLIKLATLNLQVPGEHNIRNALAALAVIHKLDLPLQEAANALSEFKGTQRRFDILGQADGVTIIDDYGHHPTEIKATLQAARQRFPQSRIWAVWEPHTYSRTMTLESDFISALNHADKVIITKIYAAREIDPGYSPKRITDALPGNKGQYIADFEDVQTYLLKNLEKNDVVLVLSAGDAPQISKQTLAGLKIRELSSK